MGVHSSAGAGVAVESFFESSAKKPEMAGSLKPNQLPSNAIVISRSDVAAWNGALDVFLKRKKEEKKALLPTRHCRSPGGGMVFRNKFYAGIF